MHNGNKTTKKIATREKKNNDNKMARAEFLSFHSYAGEKIHTKLVFSARTLKEKNKTEILNTKSILYYYFSSRHARLFLVCDVQKIFIFSGLKNFLFCAYN